MNCPRCQGQDIRKSKYGRTEMPGTRLYRLLTAQRWYRCRQCDRPFVASVFVSLHRTRKQWL